MKNMDNFCYERKPSHATAELTPFAVSKDEWDTKVDTGKSMKNALYILQYVKRLKTLLQGGFSRSVIIVCGRVIQIKYSNRAVT